MYCFILTSWDLVGFRTMIFAQSTNLTDFYRKFYFETGSSMQIRALGEKMYVKILYD